MENLYLEKKVLTENMYRFYCVHITPTLFGSWVLIRQWGRIGSPHGFKKEVWFESKEEAVIVRKKILQKKMRRGYQ